MTNRTINPNAKEILYFPAADIILRERNARTHSAKQIQEIANSIEEYGFTNPILIDGNHRVLAGVARLKAAKLLSLEKVPVVILSHLTAAQRQAYILADNKLAEKAGWDFDTLKLEFEDILKLDTNFDLGLTGFDKPEIDFIIHCEPFERDEKLPASIKDIVKEPRVKKGDLWQIHDHRLLCGDSLDETSFQALMGDDRASMVFTDPPYNVPISGHVGNKGNIQHDEFAFASGEMSDTEYLSFLDTSLSLATKYSREGSLHYVCIDWRHVNDLLNVGKDIYHELKNICVWNKQTAGMGSLYRSQHEFVCVFKKDDASHLNNVQLGKHGRYRTNVWDYPGVHATSHRKADLKFHPTVKPMIMISDAIMDCTNPVKLSWIVLVGVDLLFWLLKIAIEMPALSNMNQNTAMLFCSVIKT